MLDDDAPCDEPQDPVVVQQVELAIEPYRRLLPEEVVQDFGRHLSLVLTLHPFGMGIVARFSPGGQPPAEPNRDPKTRGFEGYAAVQVLCAMLDSIAEKARKSGETRFICPDGARRVLKAFLSYFSTDSGMLFRATDDVAKVLAGDFCAAIIACLFLGMARQLQARPELAKPWGDAGGALLEALPRALVVLRAALGEEQLALGDRDGELARRHHRNELRDAPLAGSRSAPRVLDS